MPHLSPLAQDAVDRLNGRLTLSTAEAAEVLGMSRAGVYNLIKDGTIPSLSLGRRRLIRRDALVALLTRLEAPGGDAA